MLFSNEEKETVNLDFLSLEVDGVTVLRNLLDFDCCQFTRRVLEKAISRASPEDFSPVYSGRLDLPLSLHSMIKPLQKLLCPQLVSIVSNHLGMNASMVEFGAMVANPNAPDQPAHVDSASVTRPPAGEKPHMLTTFVSLQNILPNMGALEVWRGTQIYWTEWELSNGQSRENAQLASGNVGAKGDLETEAIKKSGGPPVKMLVQTGDAYIIDSRLLHRGSANTSSNPRFLFYITFMAKNPDGRYCGTTATLRTDYENKYTLRDLVSILSEL